MTDRTFTCPIWPDCGCPDGAVDADCPGLNDPGARAHYPFRLLKTELPFSVADGRGISVDDMCGDIFGDEWFDGLALTIELKDRAEARRVMAALLRQRKGTQ